MVTPEPRLSATTPPRGNLDRMKLTRRKLAAAVAATAAAGVPLLGAAPLLAQTPAPPAPDDELKAARDRLKATGDTLAGQAVPMATEPAFQFKA
jgi:hypothetical protein